MLSNFSDWLNNIRLQENVYGSNWKYQVPQDKKQQMYDFYMLEYLLEPGVRMYLRPLTFSADEPDKAPSDDGKLAGDAARTHEDKFYYSLYEVANKLLPVLKEQFINALNFSVAAELRHLYDDNIEGKINNKPDHIVPEVRSALGEEYAQLLANYTFEKVKAKDPLTKGLIPREPLSDLFHDSSTNYRQSYRALIRAGGGIPEWSKLAAWLFRNAKWNGSYGGEPWAQIADAWGKLYKAESASQLIAYIDHIYDLQHNTGSVFTKLASFRKGMGGFSWIKDALDHKRDIVSPFEMIQYLSPSMQKLALYGLKIKTGKSWEDFKKEWPEIVQKKTEMYNFNMHRAYLKASEDYAKKYGTTKSPYSPPKPLSVRDYASNIISKDSETEKSPYSVYKINKKYLENELKPKESQPKELQPQQAPTVSPTFLSSANNPVDKIINNYSDVIAMHWKLMLPLDQDLKIARIILFIKENSSYGYNKKSNILEAIKKKYSLNTTPTEDARIMQLYAHEKETMLYFKAKNYTATFADKVLTHDEAFKNIQKLFPNAPTILMDDVTQRKIDKFLITWQNINAIKALREITAYSLPAAKAATIFRQYELMFQQISFAAKH